VAKFLGANLWAIVESEARRPGAKRIAVAYTSSLKGISLGRGDVLITDASKRQIEQRQTDVASLQAAQARGCAIYNVPSLHAKVYIFRRQIVVGSANLSRSSRFLREAAVLTSSPQIRSAALDWFDSLPKTDPLTRERLAELRKIRLLPRTGFATGSGARLTLLEALEKKDSLLDDFVFSWFETDSPLSDSGVKTEARERRVLPPGVSGKDWKWFEWEEGRGLKRVLDLAYRRKPCIQFRVKVDDDQVIKFTGLETAIGVYMLSFRMSHRGRHHRVQLIRLQHRSPGITLQGPSWRSELCNILTAGLRARPELARRIGQRRASTIARNELAALYAAGTHANE